MNRRGLLALAPLGLPFLGSPAAAVTGKRIQTTVDLVGDDPTANGALPGWPGPDWAFAGNALSASERLFWANQGFAPIAIARWVLVWNPRNAMTGVRLIQADSGPSNIAEVARFEGSPSVTPIVSAVLITDVLNTIIAGGQFKYLGHQQKGDGATGPLIFTSALEIVWDLS